MNAPNTPQKIAVIMLLANCNMQCPFCINEESMQAFTLEQAKALIDQLVQEKVSVVVLGGGEPTLWKPNVFLLASYAKSKGLLTQVGTNGILLPENYASNVNVDRYVMPLDGVTPAVHNYMRPTQKNHYQLMLQRFEELQNANKTLTVSTVVSKQNLHEVEKIGEFLEVINKKSNFIHAWHLYKFVPEGRGGATNADELLISQDQYDTIATCETAKKHSFKVFRRDNMFESQTVEFFWRQDGKLKRSKNYG